MSKFGDWFLRRPDGGTDELSVIEGTYTSIASTPEEFKSLVNAKNWQETHLLSLQVSTARARYFPAVGPVLRVCAASGDYWAD